MTARNQQQDAAKLADWIDKVERMHPENIALGLIRVQKVFQRMGIVFSCPVITVGGTNGKGSTCEMLQSIWHAAGFKVGLYTSPHIQWFNERIRINREMVDDATLVAAFETVEAARGDISLTFFEFTTLVAFAVFAQTKPDVIILEVGLGGRLDAVNIVDATVAIVTNVDIDHVNFLGHTKEAIGFEKAGIYRKDHRAFYGDVTPPETLLKHAHDIDADLHVFGRDYSYETSGDTWIFHGEKTLTDLPLPSLRGRTQIKNATTVLAVIETLQNRLPVSKEAISFGLTHTVLAGRFEQVSQTPNIIIDVAHNPHAAHVLAENLKDNPISGKTYAVYGAMADKDIRGVIEVMKPYIDAWVVSDLPLPRAAKGQDIQKILIEMGAKVDGCYLSAEQALLQVRNMMQNNDRIIAFGSFWVITGLTEQIKTQLPIKQ